MTIIHLTTELNAPIDKCFDAARSVDIHKLSMSHTNEIAVAGRTAGLCEQGDTITWEATHFGIRQNLTVEITKLDKPAFFEDRMLKGAFKSMHHEHHFSEKNGKTVMIDQFVYEVPFGAIGKIFNMIILKKYMTRLLEKRNQTIRSAVENR